MQNITNLDNPNSVIQMKQWLSDHGIEAESLGKKDVAAMIKNTDGDVATALKLRLQLAKSSVKKYQAMQSAVCKDGRAHGMVSVLRRKPFRKMGRTIDSVTEPTAKSYE